MGKKLNHLPTIHNPRYRALVKELVAMRKRAGLKQDDIAEVLGLTQPDISKIERYERRLDALELFDWVLSAGGRLEKLASKVKKYP